MKPCTNIELHNGAKNNNAHSQTTF